MCIYMHMYILTTIRGQPCMYMYMYMWSMIHVFTSMCLYMVHMHTHCAFHEWCAVTWDSTGEHMCVATLISDVIFCIPLLLATIQTH